MILLLLTSPTVAQETGVPVITPVNPVLLDYLNQKAALMTQPRAVREPLHTFGYIPEPVDYSHLRGQQAVQLMERLGLPASYDLRALDKVTPVRDQGSCGSCWAFATMGSAESNLLPGETRDFSENNLKNTAGWLVGPCDGGNGTMSTAYLARWGGPINESDDPYNAYSGVSPGGLTVQKHYQDIPLIPGRASASDNDSIKQALINYGAVFTSYYHNDAYYNPVTNAYYYTGTSNSNHAVTIVGWNDNFDKNMFLTVPPDNGAFIIKNNWGTGWGESGYFYISYYDANMGKSLNYLFMQPQETSNYKRVYQYDPLGASAYAGYAGYGDTAWGANVFTAVASENLAAVAIYTPVLNAIYEIYVYTDLAAGPTSGVLVGSTSGTIVEAGYHSVPLTSPIQLTGGQKFSIVLKLTTPGYNYPIALERPIAGFLSPTANAGESFVSFDGTSWLDITTIIANTNICVKGFTAPTLNLIIAVTGSGIVTSEQYGISCSVNCSSQFDIGTSVTLHASPAEYSLFSGWAGACTGTGDCTVLMDSNKAVTATFTKDTAHMTRIGDTASYFSTLQAAYNGAQAGGTIKAWGTDFTEKLSANINKTVTLKGGYNSSYTSNSGYTTLHGILSIGNGSLTVENLELQ